jgi:tetratricopeptide (TPR) repeat protein
LSEYSEAEYWFSQAIEALPYYHQAFYNRGLARESLDNHTDALEDYEVALKLKPDYTSAALAKSRVLEAMN